MDPGTTMNSETLSLDAWVARHGPLWPAAALIVVLDACAVASRLDDRELEAVIGSLTAAGIHRRGGIWSWTPRVEALSASGSMKPPGASGASTSVSEPFSRRSVIKPRISERDVIERLGAILFHALTGEATSDPFADEHTLRERLRALRPELSTAAADVTVAALLARRNRHATLAGFAREVRQVLGAEAAPVAPPVAPKRRALTILVLFAGLAASSWMAVRQKGGDLQPNGLTPAEIAIHDITTEAAAGGALVDEHTDAMRLYQELQRTWSARVPSADPRLAWTRAHEAWVRLLMGDRLTARQLLEELPDWLAQQLGEGHPYTRAVRLGLSHTIDPSGVDIEARSLRDAADRATRDLVGDALGESHFLRDLPMAPGVVAHVAPNSPEREGFRRRSDGTYIAPLTSVQRMLAGQNGWRLHLIATAACRAWAVVDTVPRLVSVLIEPDVTGWRLIVDGTKPAMTLRTAAAGRAGVSLVADGSGSVSVTLGSESITLPLDTAGPIPAPPYGIGFSDEGTASGCSVVWLELPVPPREIEGLRQAAVSASPAVLVQHRGRTDPRNEGFMDRGGMETSAPIWNDLDLRDAWQISGRGCCSSFYHPVDGAAVFAQEWRFRAIVRIGKGSGHAALVLDTGAERPRFDINVAAIGGDAVITLPGSTLSHRVPGAAHRWLELELRYNPASARASLFVDGAQRLTGYRGWGWYRENRGVMFGTADVTANFNVVRLETGPGEGR